MSKCTHDSSEVIFTHNEISVEICSWGCSELLVSVTKENGITDTFTVSEISAMQARIESLEGIKRIAKELYDSSRKDGEYGDGATSLVLEDSYDNSALLISLGQKIEELDK